tara:strand:- start:559 stop:1368 length:810 start_codon:yes stop_codon:yes gene_type:complete
MRTTEQESLYQNLEKQSVFDLLTQMNKEDLKVPKAVSSSIPQINALVENILPRMKKGGRLFYLGAGTSGRLGILDASECPPTYGVSHDLVVGLIAGGDGAIRKAVEFAEDNIDLGWSDLQKNNISEWDSVIGIAASGTTPYVIGALKSCQKENILTGCITCNANSPLTKCSDFPVEVVVGPEYVTGSTRMKAGTAQKLVLNMISTSLMIKLGKVQGNKMVDMQLSNDKLVARGSRMVAEATHLDIQKAKEYLLKYGSVRLAVKAINDGN